MQQPCIYVLYFKDISSCYIGQTVDIARRYAAHKNELVNNKHLCQVLKGNVPHHKNWRKGA